jgi:LAS superfamily LD-carboxypeptidase LdcB
VNSEELTGQARTHVAAVPGQDCQLHTQVIAPFLNLRSAAAAAGFELAALSGFRDFARQLTIWNGKFNGTRPMYGADGAALDAAAIAPRERIDAILQWSALPGASRHHWGTDVDLIDRRAPASRGADPLTRQAFASGGPFAPLGEWLDAHAPRFGFFRPFQGIRSGVQPEPWHFSFAPIAETARRALRPEILAQAIAAVPLLGKEWVLERLDEIHERYVAMIDLP